VRVRADLAPDRGEHLLAESLRGRLLGQHARDAGGERFCHHESEGTGAAGSLKIPSAGDVPAAALGRMLDVPRRGAAMSVTVVVRNQVHDFASWKEAFDRYERFRADHGVRSYRVLRQADEPSQVTVELDLDTLEQARALSRGLQKIWATPLSRAQLVSHDLPVVLTLVEAAAPPPVSTS
jgi:hypothetical protein